MEISIALAAVLLWILVSPRFSPALYNRWLFKPNEYCGSADDVAAFSSLNGREMFFLNRQGVRLHSWLLGERSESANIVLYCMGNDGDIAKRAHILSVLLNSGLPIFIFEYSGFGESEGKVSIDNVCADAIDAFDFVLQEFGKQPSQVILYGESLGGAVSVNLLKHRNPGALILKSTFSSLKHIAQELCPILRIYPQLFIPQLNTVRDLKVWKNSSCPLLIVHGRGDRKIGWKHSQQLFKAARKPKAMILLPQSRHAFMDPQDEDFFLESIRCFTALVISLQEQQAAELECEILEDLSGAVDRLSARQVRLNALFSQPRTRLRLDALCALAQSRRRPGH